MEKKLLITILLIGIAFGIGSLFWIPANLQPDIQLNGIIDGDTEDIDSTKTSTDNELAQAEKADKDSSSEKTANEKAAEKEIWLCISEEEIVASTGDISDSIDYKYNENGLLIESVRHKTSDDNITRYFYDENNNCVLQSDYSLQKGIHNYFLQDRKYLYNDDNELTKEYLMGSGSYDTDTYNEYNHCCYWY